MVGWLLKKEWFEDEKENEYTDNNEAHLQRKEETQLINFYLPLSLLIDRVFCLKFKKNSEGDR
jgi:hypothetical protein